ncbi:MAG: basic amino acid ABC transporter substrate-binding protein [Acidaminococcaceae bacterium]|nr:basic amino acid ABC transporter substrate-binding protein [Acidaminococcaceae bacterium]MCI2109841.1 basic amino acid ABC transporter substrate-binding protein [Acidaminococcaceae bacterium]
MKKTRGLTKWTGILLLTILVVFSLMTGCGKKETVPKAAGAPAKSKASSIEQIKKKGKLVLATGNYRPFEYHDEKTNKTVGYDIDLAEAIAKKLGVPLEVKDMQFTSLIPSLQNGQVDIVIAAMYITDARKQAVDFAKPYMKTGMVLAVNAGNTDIKSTKDLNGKTVGVKTGATSEKVAQDLKKQGINMTIKSYKETVDYLMDMENGRTDASINDLLNQLEYDKTHPNVKIVGEPFTKAELGIAVKKGSNDLVDLINGVLAEMDKNGESKKLYDKWLIGKK